MQAHCSLQPLTVDVDDHATIESMGGLRYPDKPDEQPSALRSSLLPDCGRSIEEKLQNSTPFPTSALDRDDDYFSIKSLIDKATWCNALPWYKCVQSAVFLCAARHRFLQHDCPNY